MLAKIPFGAGPVAQLDRALAFEAKGWEFESLRGRQSALSVPRNKKTLSKRTRHRTSNLGVGGSNPSETAILPRYLRTVGSLYPEGLIRAFARFWRGSLSDTGTNAVVLELILRSGFF